MFIFVDEIGPEGLELDAPVKVGLLEDALGRDGAETGFRAAGGAQLKASLHRVSGGVLLEGRFSAPLAAPCKRCLADVLLALPVSFTLNLIARKRAQEELGPIEDDERAESAGSFDLDQADQEFFDGKTIDLDPILREQVLLALPMNVVCSEDCQGLCPMCGQNLNEGKCGCEPKTVDPRFAVLKDMKLN